MAFPVWGSLAKKCGDEVVRLGSSSRQKEYGDASKILAWVGSGWGMELSTFASLWYFRTLRSVTQHAALGRSWSA